MQIGLHCRPSSSASSDDDSDATGRSSTSSLSSGDAPRPIATVNVGHLGVRASARSAVDGRKPFVPSSGLAMQVGTERRIFHGSQLGEGLVTVLDGPSLDAFILGLKAGSNGHEGREVRDEVPGHNWHQISIPEGGRKKS